MLIQYKTNNISANKHLKLTHWVVAPFKIMGTETTINNLLSRQLAVGA